MGRGHLIERLLFHHGGLALFRSQKILGVGHQILGGRESPACPATPPIRDERRIVNLAAEAIDHPRFSVGADAVF